MSCVADKVFSRNRQSSKRPRTSSPSPVPTTKPSNPPSQAPSEDESKPKATNGTRRQWTASRGQRDKEPVVNDDEGEPEAPETGNRRKERTNRRKADGECRLCRRTLSSDLLRLTLWKPRIRARGWIPNEDGTTRARTSPNKSEYADPARTDSSSAVDAQIRAASCTTRPSRTQPVHERPRCQRHRDRVAKTRAVARYWRRLSASGIQWYQRHTRKWRGHRTPQQTSAHAPAADNVERDETACSRYSGVHLAHAG